MKKETPQEFLRRHNMYYEAMPFETLTDAYIDDIRRGLRGEESTLYMLPSYLNITDAPKAGESVLVLDAGGTNLRAGRVHFDDAGKPVVEDIRKRRMPGTNGTAITADEMFRAIAELALPFAEGTKRACIAFSYACESLPNGDGRILGLGKEARVTGTTGRLVCEGIETALRALGAKGERKWRLVNDTVGSLLGGMATCDRSRYDDYIGFILGTGTNTCCLVPASSVTKSPETAAMSGDTVVNLESGQFSRLLRGTVDLEIDAESELHNDHIAEKMISGAYYRVLFGKTLKLAAKEGIISSESGANIEKLGYISSAMIDDFCVSPMGGCAIADALVTEADRIFAEEINKMLLERAAVIAASCIHAIMRLRGFGADKCTAVCADGTMLRLNPVLLPRMKELLAEYGARHGLGSVEFVFAGDATLLGCAWAALTD